VKELERLSVLINESPTEEFCMAHGVRQGGLMSPFLFNLVVEGQSVLLQHAQNNGLPYGINLGDIVDRLVIFKRQMTIFFTKNL
jgi:hypothetical protein